MGWPGLLGAALCTRVAAGLGLPAPTGHPALEVTVAPALSEMIATPGPVTGRKIGIIADTGSDLADIVKLKTGLAKVGVTVLTIAPVGGC